jgi:phosphoserine phosphatase
MALRSVIYLIVDRFDRSLFNRLFYRLYRGRDASPAARARAGAWLFDTVYRRKIFPAARIRIAELRRAGTEVVLVTGSPDWAAAPVARALGCSSTVLGARLEADADVDSRAGQGRRERFTGRLAAPPVADGEKAVLARAYAAERGVELTDCAGYGDAWGDAPLLRACGTGHAVSPDARLRAEAVRLGWEICEWREKR